MALFDWLRKKGKIQQVSDTWHRIHRVIFSISALKTIPLYATWRRCSTRLSALPNKANGSLTHFRPVPPKKIENIGKEMIRFGLCCTFHEQPIKFTTTTAKANGSMERSEGLAKIARLCAANAEALMAALRFCADNGIGCFRMNSQILPLKKHPQLGYEMADLPSGDEIVKRFQGCGEYARENNLRLCFHPDQFVVLNSQKPEVVEASLRELEYQGETAEWVGADVINIHGGGAFGDKPKALGDFARNLQRLSSRVRNRLTVENDDTVYTPADLLPVCRAEGLPLVYDVHHHRCLPDGLSIEEATTSALATWNREPLFHLSSPIEGWQGRKPERHHDFIDGTDFPECWKNLDITVEVEAKAKEVAVLALKRSLNYGPTATQSQSVADKDLSGLPA